MTNGTYAHDKDMFLPTSIAAFHYILYHEDSQALPLVIFINSDKGLEDIRKKHSSDTPAITIAPQQDRAYAIAKPLALHFQRQVFVLFFDDETPENIYENLREFFLATDSTLHKWGYGATVSAPVIVGSSYFKRVFSFPLPGSQVPYCHRITPSYASSFPKNIRMVDVREILLNADGRLVRRISLNHGMEKYQAKRYNIVLMPKDIESQFLKTSEVLIRAVGSFGLKYHLRAETGLPHVSVFQMELPSTDHINKVARIVQNIWSKVSVPPFSHALHFSSTVHTKYDEQGEFANTTWFELRPVLNTGFVKAFHNKVYDALSKAGLVCLNACKEHYQPHITLASYQGNKVFHGRLPAFSQDTQMFFPYIVEANWEWEAVKISCAAYEPQPELPSSAIKIL